ncbi:hypothetical protein V1478_010135 [Vespula squamosa]|uniref:Uncharacterized protein n=1 Tax=Vespula squamosa TaxID=30214 RepID=A0ABD2AIX0_VESSQ
MIVLLITTVCKERALVSLHRLFAIVHFSLASLSTNRRLDDDGSAKDSCTLGSTRIQCRYEKQSELYDH